MVSDYESHVPLEHIEPIPPLSTPTDQCIVESRLQLEQSLNPRRILWQPSPEQIGQSNMMAFLRFLREMYEGDVPSMERLYTWSIECPRAFWHAWFEFSNIIHTGSYKFSLEHRGPRMIDAQWFPDIRLNFAENLLHHANLTPNKEAMTFWNEEGFQQRYTYRELRQDVMGFSRLLDACNVRQNDRVVALLPNIPQAVSAMLATTARGAIWSSVSPEFGIDSIVDRFGQLEPKILITTNSHRYRGKTHPVLDNVQAILERIPSITNTIVVPSMDPSKSLDIRNIRGAILWDPSLVDRNVRFTPSFPHLPFNHPVYILFSSGTTGKPKCIVHSAGGTLLNHFKEHRLHTDIKKNDTVFYFTTTNWMMWNWLVSGLGTGSRIVLYDGDPMHRGGRILFDLAEEEQITVFGTSAKFLSSIERNGLKPRETHNLKSIRTILSTGSTLYGSQFDFVYNDVHPTAQVSSISGGTDLLGGWAVGDPTKPVHREELQTRSLGYKVEVFDDTGNPVPPGVRGELVCTAPFPSQPIGFWNDPNNERYRATYFQKYGPNVWHHGDFAELTESGGMVIHGRSDATLNPGGVRIGTADIYKQMEKMPDILEAIVIGQKVEQDERIVLFVVLANGNVLTADFEEKIRRQIRSGTSPRHVPAKIVSVPDLPRTRNGKLSELAVKATVNGIPVKNMDALANPESLTHFRNRPELAV